MTFLPCVIIFLSCLILVILDTVFQNVVISTLLSACAVLNSIYMVVNYFGSSHAKAEYPQLKSWILPLSCFLALMGGTIDIINLFKNNLSDFDSYTIRQIRNSGLYLYTIWLLVFHLNFRTESSVQH